MLNEYQDYNLISNESGIHNKNKDRNDQDIKNFNLLKVS
jgi:hypothetical protein